MSKRSSLRRLAASVGLALMAAPAGAAEWFVAPDGNDATGDGSAGKPFRTLTRVLDTARPVVQAGDTVTVRAPPGAPRYEECNVRLRVKLTLRSAPGERAHIHCDPATPESVVVRVDPPASGSRVQGLTLSGSQYYGVVLQTLWYRGDQERFGGATDVVLEDLWIHDTGRDGIKLTPKADRATIRRCRIWNTGALYPPGTPLERKNADGIDNVNAAGMVVEDCHIHDVATSGLYFKGGARGALVQRNRIEDAGQAGILVGFDTSEEFFDPKDNPRYHEAIGGVVRNNLVRRTGYAGIGLYAAADALVANNTLVDTARLGHAAIYFGVTFQDWDPRAGRPPSVRPRIVNNLVLGTGTACIAIRHSDELGGLSALDGTTGTDHNAFPPGCRYADARPPRPLPAVRGLDRWRRHAGVDAHSIERDPDVGDDLRPRAGSPLVDAGIAVDGLSDDLDGRPRRGAPDIGAFEAPGPEAP